MDLSSLTQTPTEETVQEYVDIFRKTDLKTAAIALGILLIGFLSVRLILKLVRKGMERSGIPASLHSMIRTMLRITLDMIVLLTAANYLGLPITSFLALLGLAGLAVSLALQSVLNNLAGGFIILSSHPFEVGHFVEHDGISGTVAEIRLQHTRLETPDGKMIYIPNSSLAGSRLINYSETGKRRVEIRISASYDNSPEQVREAILSAVRETGGILADPEPVVSLDEYGDSAISYVLWVWVQSGDFLTVKRELNERMYGAFRKHGVEMTYPHLNVHMNSPA